jgi:hypothetical protein
VEPQAGVDAPRDLKGRDGLRHVVFERPDCAKAGDVDRVQLRWRASGYIEPEFIGP